MLKCRLILTTLSKAWVDRLFKDTMAKKAPEIDHQSTFLIVGLGNPGQEHKMNRHNIGYMVLDELAKEIGFEFRRMKFEALVEKGNFGGKQILLAKPRSYMNRSGIPVAALARFYKLDQSHIMLVYDDVDLDFERIRLRPEGGSAGQKGMKSVIESLDSQAFPRLRMGIGRPPGKMNTPAYVLQDFSKKEQMALPFVLKSAAEALKAFMNDGIDAAMNEFNRKSDD